MLGRIIEPTSKADTIRVLDELGKEIIHVHAKDVRIERRRSDVNGVLDPLPPAATSQRAWNYVTLGNGHAGGAEFWRDFVYTLRTVGYEGPLSIEHEDVLVSGEEGVERSVEILRSTLFQQAPDWVPADV
uniref:TIM barrel protein n=1 Tax=Tessaracoccus timonensis TaxID=2161816 RepID=UPI000D55B16A|nr:TIM barrel protein [Tessaracoccus timonensis]